MKRRMGAQTSRSGFTIVELLIVIVVIAILAAITIVAYAGIQERAKESQTVSMLNAYVKGVNLYYRTYGDTLPVANTACFDGTVCWGSVSATDGATLRTELSKVMGTLPEVPSGVAALFVPSSTTSDSVNGGDYTGTYILYQYPDSGSCATIGGTRFLNTGASNGVRTCRAAIELN